MDNLVKQCRKALSTQFFVATFAIVLVALFTLAPDFAHAGAAVGGPLDDVYTTLTTWTQGSVGKVVMIAFILVGIVAGIAKQSLLAFAVGIGAGLGIYNAPTIVDTVFTAIIQ